MGCFGGLGPCLCALTAAIGGNGNDGSADFFANENPGPFAAGGAAKGGTKGAGLAAWAMGGNEPLPMGGIIDGADGVAMG